jgi:hypothetical protein
MHQFRRESVAPSPPQTQQRRRSSVALWRQTVRQLNTGKTSVGPAAAQATLLTRLSRGRSAAALASNRLRGRVADVGRFGHQSIERWLKGDASASAHTGGAGARPVGGKPTPALPIKIVP